MIIDAILKPVDNYWKKQYNAERIRRQRAEADAKCYKDEADYNHETLAIVSDRELKQARAIEAYNKEVAELKQRLKDRETELSMTRQLLDAERRASKAYQLSERLWQASKAKEGA